LQQKAVCFNSRLVRLAVPIATTNGRLIEFQFQIGAIGSMKKRIELWTKFKFQFQIGAIGRLIRLLN